MPNVNLVRSHFDRLLKEPANDEAVGLIEAISGDPNTTEVFQLMLALSAVRALHNIAGALQSAGSTLDDVREAIDKL